MIDRLNEIWQTLRRNPLRTMLTAFGVGWGIFMLMIVLGSGNALENGVRSMFNGFASNSIYLWGRSTSTPYQGYAKGRRVTFDASDISYLKAQVKEIDVLAPRNQLGGWRGGNNVVYKDRTGAFSVTGDIPDYQKINIINMVEGRFLNEKDLSDERKVAVIGKRVQEVLFKNENPIGQYILINGVYFQVVGSFNTLKSGSRAERDEQTIYIPFTTFQKAFKTGGEIAWFAILCKEGSDAVEVEKKIKSALYRKHHIHPNDIRAIGGFNAQEDFARMENTFNTVRFVGWLVGIMTLLAGAVGVSNIMLITIRERTRELGIRRALGATPYSIVSQVMIESLVLTLLAGYVGMIIGIWGLEALNGLGITTDYFKNPSVELQSALIAMGVLTMAGLLAGVLPARKALAVKPVEALRWE
jgi:putative ABC transport system permease protein